MRMLLIAGAALAVSCFEASAGCEFATGPCSTDSYGNTYRTEENYGGGYSTSRNGMPYSSTEQTQSGNYRERFNDGASRSYNYNPHEPSDSRNSYGYR